MRLHFPNPNIIFGSYKMVVCVLILFAPAYLHPYVLRVGLVWFGLGFKIFLEITCLGMKKSRCMVMVMDCMSEKNILADPGGSNSASFESETHDP